MKAALPDLPAQPSKALSSRRRVIFNVTVLILTLILLFTQRESFLASSQTITLADSRYIFLIILVLSLNYCLAASSYYFIAYHKIKYFPTLAVQTAAGFVSRLLPAGVGGLGIYTLYLKSSGFSLGTATAMAITNNLLGLLASSALVIVAVIFYPAQVAPFKFPELSSLSWYLILVVVCLVVIIAYVVRTKLVVLLAKIKITIAAVGISFRRGWPITIAFSANVLLACVTALTVNLAATAVGADMTLVQSFLIITLGTLVGAVVPTPGGLGGVEAGMIAGFVLYGVPYGQALTAVLFYRALTYWLPMIPGFIAYKMLEGRYFKQVKSA